MTGKLKAYYQFNGDTNFGDDAKMNENKKTKKEWHLFTFYTDKEIPKDISESLIELLPTKEDKIDEFTIFNGTLGDLIERARMDERKRLMKISISAFIFVMCVLLAIGMYLMIKNA